MNAWGWLLAYVLGFGLLQLLLYRYFQGDDASLEVSPNPVDRSAATGGEHPVEHRPDEDESDDSVVHCRHCGAPNDADGSYTFCQECVSPLR